MIRITKPTVRLLNAAVGKLDVDTGQVFTGFIGRLHIDDRLWHGELHYADVGDEPPADEVSIKSILSPDGAVPEDEAAIQTVSSPAEYADDSDREED